MKIWYCLLSLFFVSCVSLEKHNAEIKKLQADVFHYADLLEEADKEHLKDFDGFYEMLNNNRDIILEQQEKIFKTMDELDSLRVWIDKRDWHGLRKEKGYRKHPERIVRVLGELYFIKLCLEGKQKFD